MKDIKAIIEGFSNLAVKKANIEVLAEQRLKICNACPYNSKSLVPYCKSCGCVIEAKVRSLESNCPKEKW